MGHPQSVCRIKQRRRGKQEHVHPVLVAQVEEDDKGPLYVLQAHIRVAPLKVTVELDMQSPNFHGSGHRGTYWLVSEATYREIWPDKKLDKCNVRLSTYSNTRNFRSPS